MIKMQEKHHADKISAKDFEALLKAYDDEIAEKLHQLEEQRLGAIPTALLKRKDDAYLKKAELQTLMDWKLYEPWSFGPSL